MDLGVEADHGTECIGNKRPDPEGVAYGGDSKRSREKNGDLHHFSMEMEEGDDDDEDCGPPPNTLDLYRRVWMEDFGPRGISFEDETQLPNMRHTDGPIISGGVGTMETMQVFAVKVVQITDGLHWPLDVYGVVAARDSMDHKRNYLFRRGRDKCQTLTSLQDSLLELTGPSRAVLLLDPHAFEVDLKVKGKGSPSEDKALCYDAFVYNSIVHIDKASYAITEVMQSKHSNIEVRFAHLRDSLEATVSIHVVSGTNNFSARFTARTASIDDEMVLLDSRGGKVAVADDGEVGLLRRVVTVEEKGKLIIGVEAACGDAAAESDSVVVKQITATPRHALRTQGTFNLGFSRLRVLIAWSLLPPL